MAEVAGRRKTQRTPEGDPGVRVQSGTPIGLRERRFQLTRESGKANTAPMRLLAPQMSAPLPSSGPEDGLPPPPWEPLLNPQWTRAMISTMARIRTPAGPPDVETLVTLTAERKPIFTLPATILETASGADVLLDIGESMTVFGRDQEDLLGHMRRVLGAGLVSVFRFFGSPMRGVLGNLSFEPEPYRPPPPGWPVILLTDLGIGAGTTAPPTQEWRWFADLVHGAGCHLVALVPYPPVRWPSGILSSMDIVQWERSTSVGTIRSAIGRTQGSCR